MHVLRLVAAWCGMTSGAARMRACVTASHREYSHAGFVYPRFLEAYEL